MKTNYQAINKKIKTISDKVKETNENVDDLPSFKVNAQMILNSQLSRFLLVEDLAATSKFTIDFIGLSESYCSRMCFIPIFSIDTTVNWFDSCNETSRDRVTTTPIELHWEKMTWGMRLLVSAYCVSLVDNVTTPTYCSLYLYINTSMDFYHD